MTPPTPSVNQTVSRPAGPSTPVAVERVRVELVPEAPQRADEIERLLRKRLRIIVCTVGAFYTVQLARSAAIWFRCLTGPPTDWYSLTAYTLIAVTMGGFAWVLSGGRPLSLRSLRVIELITFLQVAAFAAWITQHELRSEWVGRYAEADDLGPLLVTRAHAFNWFVLIILYGTLIPNTWRRCAAVVGAIALTALAVGAGVCLSDEVLRSHLLGSYLTDMAVWLAVAVAVAVYGSHRIEHYRRQATAARKLGQYVLKERLGGGGMGEVYRAEHLLLRRPCALKVIRPDRAGDPKTLLRFEREVRLTATLTHPNTVQIYDYGHADDGTFYYVMEYLPGVTLYELVRRHGPLPPGRAIHLLRQVCAALREAHAHGLIHRDIKPGNVMVCERGGVHDAVKLLDFGLVLSAAEGDGEKLTREGAVTGTPAYLSPEQADGRDTLDGRSDLYSVGALAYFLLTGKPPFADRSVVKMLAAHLYEPPAPLTRPRPDVPTDLEAIVLRCLAKDPADRYLDAEGLESALASCPAAHQWSDQQAAGWWEANAVATAAGDHSSRTRIRAGAKGEPEGLGDQTRTA